MAVEREASERPSRMPFAIHSSFIWGFLVAPAIFYLYYRNRSEALRLEAAKAFDFQLAVYVIFGGASIIAFMVLVVRLDQTLLFAAAYLVAYLWVWWLAIRAFVRAWRGQPVGYPTPFRILGRLREQRVDA